MLLKMEENISSIIITLGCVYLGYALAEYLRKKNLIRKAINGKRATVNDTTTKFEDRLKEAGKAATKQWEAIVQMPIGELIAALQNRHITSLDVLRAYQFKALEITKDLNCVTEFITEAEDWAKQLDSSEVVKGPLHGLPFSVKDNVQIVGYDCTIGVSKFLNLPYDTDAALVQALKQLGAIPFCKTNIPQTLLSFGCGNPVWGTSKNPHNKYRTPGGSSGGEGCLVAAGGSPFGLGSDIGGSTRAPAAFCGVYSLKPTSNRLSYRGYQKSVKGCVGVDAISGIIARDVETVILINKLLLQDSLIANFDPKLPPIPWRENLFSLSRKLRIGYYDYDGFFPTTPGVQRSIEIARRNLEKLGHELIPFQPLRAEEALGGFVHILQADAGRYLRKICDGESLDPSIKTIYMGLVTPNIIKPLIVPIIRLLSPRLVPVLQAAGGNGISRTHQLWQQLLDQDELREALISAWKKQDLDLCLGPAFSCPAPLTQDIGRLFAAGSYTIYYNYVNFPAGVVPVTKENEEDQARLLKDYNDKDLLCKLVKKTTRGAVGMPISVQVIGLPYREELVLRGMEILNSTLN